MSEQAMTNGPSESGKYIDKIDPDDPEYIRQMRRPAEVKEDINQMANRKRVGLVLHSQLFRDELEELVTEQMKAGASSSRIAALQHISELLVARGGSQPTSSAASKLLGPVIPVADIRGVDSMNYVKGEKIVRCKLASFYRLVEMFGWAGNLQGMITVRISQDVEHFLTAPYGMLYHEVTASSLVKMDMQGDILDPGSLASLTVNKDCYHVHTAIHAARPDIKCLLHLRSPQAISLSSMKSGLLPVSQEAISLGEPAYFVFNGDMTDAAERDKLARALGPINKVLILRNFGVLVGGDNVDETFLLARNLVTAIETQCQLLPVGLDNILLPSQEVRQRTYEQSRVLPTPEEGKRKWRRGEMEFESWMRYLDSSGYRTGHIYREPNLKRDRRMERANSEVEIPPTTSNLGYYEDGELKSPLKMVIERQKKQQKTDWLNTPNAYRREEQEEIGTPNPKKITKWVEEKTPGKGNTPVKVEHPNQFAPQGENPKELKEKYKAIKKEYFEERVDAGPQSRILEGTTWDEAQKINEGLGDKVILVGAASKGIIQKDHQHNVGVYKTYYAQNPFDNMSEEEMARYQQQIQQGEKGEGVANETAEEQPLEPGPDGKLISTNERMKLIREGGVELTQEVVPTAPPAQPVSPVMASPAPVTPATGHQDATVGTQRVKVAAGEAVVVAKVDSPKKKKSKKPANLELTDEVDANFQRSQSARFPDKSPELIQELEKQPSFEREKAKSERKPKKKKVREGVNGEQLGSPTKSTSSGDGTLDDRSSREGSPSKDVSTDPGSPEKGGEKKKKKFRMPSFSKGKKEKEKKPAKQSAV